MTGYVGSISQIRIIRGDVCRLLNGYGIPQPEEAVRIIFTFMGYDSVALALYKWTISHDDTESPICRESLGA
jgi:hypothetical protein